MNVWIVTWVGKHSGNQNVAVHNSKEIAMRHAQLHADSRDVRVYEATQVSTQQIGNIESAFIDAEIASYEMDAPF